MKNEEQIENSHKEKAMHIYIIACIIFPYVIIFCIDPDNVQSTIHHTTFSVEHLILVQYVTKD